MKICFKCGEQKPRTEFYAHPRMADGLLGKCKTCTKRDTYASALRFAERHPEVARARANAKAKAYQARNKEKYAARKAVERAIRRCRMTRGACEIGEGCAGRIEGHHENYDEPLTVRWLCRKHHREHHKKNPF